MGIDKLDKNKAFGITVACGIVSPNGEPFSEAHLLIAFQGQRDSYIVQWSEVGPASKTPIEFDARWVQRFNTLMQVRLCPRIPGEPAPYPSCLERSEQ